MDRMTHLDTAFAPGSIAVAGVGPMTAGKCYLESLLDSGFQGGIYPIHPDGGEILGFDICRSVKDIPDPVDCVISCIPARFVPQLIRDSADKGVKVISLFTSGFSETGTAEGRRLEEEILRLAEASGLRLIGPNCMGVYSPSVGVSFVSDFPRETGRVAFVCQSGGNTIYFIRLAAERGIRFSKAISYGNASDIDESDLFEYLAQDDETDVVATYIEGVKNGERFYQALSQLCARKPVIAIKGGQTEAGARTAASHTGSLAGSDTIWSSLLEQAGAIQVDSLHELLDMLVTFQFLPLPAGRNVAMVGGGGGASVLATDACAGNGFAMPAIPADIVEDIRGFVDNQPGLIFSNPTELNMLPEATYNVARRMLTYEGIDFMMANCVFGQEPWPMFAFWFDNFCDTVVKVHAEVKKPMAVVTQSGLSSTEQHFRALLQRYVDAGLPVYYSMQGACKAIDRFMRYYARRSEARELSATLGPRA